MKFLNKCVQQLLIAVLACSSNVAIACTDFRITAQDGTVLITRSMEFALDLKSNVNIVPRGQSYTTVAPDGKPGIAWTGQYGYAYLDGFGSVIEGMNEKGLSIEALYLPGLAEYQTVPADKDSQAVPYVMLGTWVLSNFKTVAEVRAALPNVLVFAQKIPGQGNTIFPLHFSFHDATGDSLVAEYIGGELHLYDNPLGIMTNCPAFDWHVTNLNNYVYLKPTNPKPIVVKGLTFASTGQGGGMLGLPGDITPPSRFVKTAVLVQTAMPSATAADALNMAQHIINNVDIPLGLAREESSGNYTNEYTQWVVFKDLTHNKLYYRTYADTSLRVVDLNKVNFDAKAPQLKMPVLSQQNLVDVTDQLLNSKAS